MILEEWRLKPSRIHIKFLFIFKIIFEEDIMMLNRQTNRYYPKPSDFYFEVNNGISIELDSLRNLFIDRKIVDIGSGEIPFEDFYIGLNVVTCDIQQNKQNSINYLINDNGKLPFKNEEYDIIFLFDVLEHIKDDANFINECYRILKPGGIIVASIPFMYRFHEQPYDYRRYTPSGIKYLFEEVGNFVIKKIKPLGSPLYVLEYLISESELKLKGWRKFIYRFICSFAKLFADSKEISFSCPFSYFIVASKI